MNKNENKAMVNHKRHSEKNKLGFQNEENLLSSHLCKSYVVGTMLWDPT